MDHVTHSSARLNHAIHDLFMCGAVSYSAQWRPAQTSYLIDEHRYIAGYNLQFIGARRFSPLKTAYIVLYLVRSFEISTNRVCNTAIE